MVIGSAAIVADGPPLTDAAVLDRIRINLAKFPREHLTLETGFYKTVISEKVIEPKRFRFKIASRRDNMRMVRPTVLNFGDQFRIQAELQDCPASGLVR